VRNGRSFVAAGTLVVAFLPVPVSAASGMEDCPMHAQHASSSGHQHQSDRGEKGMGFSQEKTTHHFALARDGGRIQVTANATDDQVTVEQVRSHLKHIAVAFREGDFAIPMFVHEQTPPGVPAMKRLRSAISYQYEGRPDGGAVVIRSKNPEAIAAVQEFLRFQIREHETGDPLQASP